MGTVVKALSLLNFFSSDQPTIGLSEMSRLAGQNKATTYRLLSELQLMGFVEQTGTAREYRLGPAVLRLASLREEVAPIHEIARNVTRSLSDSVGETAHMTLLTGGMLQLIAYSYSAAHGTKVTMEDAQLLPLHASSSGLSVLAWAASDIRDQILSEPLEAHTPNTLTDPDRIRALLPEILANGFAEYVGGFESDVHTFGAPIFNVNTRVIGAVSVAAPVARITPETREHIAEQVRIFAIQLTELSGGQLPASYPTFES